MPDLYIDIGNVYLKQRLWEKAENSFKKALEINSDSALGHYGLGISLLRQNNFETAAEEFLTAIGLKFFFPFAHFFLGKSLLKLHYYERAAEAFEVCVSQNPGIKRAHLLLVQLYKYYLYRYDKANVHLRFINEKIKKPQPFYSGAKS